MHQRIHLAKPFLRLGGVAACVLATMLAGCGNSDQDKALAAINQATAGAIDGEPYLPEPGTFKIDLAAIKPGKVKLDGQMLVVEAGFCIIGLKGGPSLDDCRADDTLWTPYRLTAELGSLDPATVKVNKGQFGQNRYIRTIYSLNVDCRKDAGKCVDHSTQGPRTFLGLPCHNKMACDGAVASLKALVEQAAK